MEQHIGKSTVISLRIAFLLVLGAGTLGILVGWWMRSVLITLVIPLACITAYLALGIAEDRNNVSNAQFADSLYYLGFLFTLIALTISLMALGFEEGYEISDLVARFGLALMTTVVGLGVRIYLTNFHGTFEDSMANAEAALERASQGLRTQLDRMSVDMVAQNEAMKAALTHALDISERALVGATGTMKAALRNASEELSSTISASCKELKDQSEKGGDEIVRATGQIHERMSETLQNAAGKVERAGTDLANSIEAIALPADALLQSIEPDIQELKQQLKECSEQIGILAQQQGNAVTNIQSFINVLDDVANSLGGAQVPLAGFAAVSESAGQLGEKVDLLKTTVDATCTALRTHMAEITAQADALAGLRSSMQTDSEVISEQREKIRREVAQAQDSLSLMYHELVKAANYIIKEIGDDSG